MSKTGTWLAMVRRDRIPSLDDLARRLGEWPGVAGFREDDRTVIAKVDDSYTKTKTTVTIGLNDNPYVLEESAEIANYDGADLPERDVLARSDARFEIVWALVDSEATFNARLFIADLLKEMAGAIVFDTTGGGFI